MFNGLLSQAALAGRAIDLRQKCAQALDVPSYNGFVMPELRPVFGPAGDVIDVTISCPRSLEAQMLGWSGRRPRS